MSVVVNGKFIKGGKPKAIKITSQHKAYSHEMQRLDSRRDIIQPRAEGHANPEFIQEYPEQAQKYFSQQDIERYGNG